MDHFVTVEVSINIFSVSDSLAGDGDHAAANTVAPSRWYEDFFSFSRAAPLASELASGRSQSPAASSLSRQLTLTSRRHESPSLLFLLPPGLSLPTSARILPMIFPLPRVKSGLSGFTYKTSTAGRNSLSDRFLAETWWIWRPCSCGTRVERQTQSVT